MPKTKQFDEVEVLKKAKEVFNEKGYNGTSIDDLVKATGLSRSSIYDTFGDKHGLFIKTIEHYQILQQSSLQQLLAKTNSPKKKITILLQETVREITEDQKRQGCLLLNAGMELSCSDKKVASLATIGMNVMEGLLYDWIKEGQSIGEIPKRFTAKALAKHFYNCFVGLKATGKQRNDRDALMDIVKVNLSILEM